MRIQSNRLPYPPVVTLKKGILLGSAFLMCVVIGGLLFYNLGIAIDSPSQSHKKSAPTNILRTANNEDIGWFAQHPNPTQPPAPMEAPLKDTMRSTDSVPTASKPVTPLTQQSTSLSEKPSQIVDEEVQKAMSAPISSNQIQAEPPLNVTEKSVQPITESNALNTGPLHESHPPSSQKAFIQSNRHYENPYSSSMVENPVSPLELQAGSIIPGILITGLNSDLPGSLIGQVRSPVYDTISGNHVLIPQGAKLIGLYNSQIIYGQERVLVVWKRVLFPNGQSLDLEGMQGVDMRGYAGFTDKVNNHYGKLLSSVLLMSVLSAGAQLSQPQQSAEPFTAPSVNQMLAQSLGTTIANVGSALVQRDLTVQPTLEIRPGYVFNIMVTKDIIFTHPYDAPITG